MFRFVQRLHYIEISSKQLGKINVFDNFLKYKDISANF